MKKILIIALPFILGLLYFTVSKEINSTKNVDYWSKNIKLCQNENLKTENEVYLYSYDCLKNSIRSSVYNESFYNWVKAAEPIMADDIRLEYVCHIPGHDLGREFSQYFKDDYRKAIFTLGFDICGGGIVHGIFDVWGGEKHSLSEWLDISKACIEQNLLRYSTCGDAIGHSAYESNGQSLEKAIYLCDKLQQSWIRNSCANGAFMQRYFPQSSKLKIERSEAVPDWDSLITFCDNLLFTQLGTSDGCYGGAGWVIGNDIFFKSQKYSKSKDNDFIGSDEAIVKTSNLIEKAFNSCRSNFDKNKNKSDPSNCLNLMLNRMPLFWYMNPDKFIDNCFKINEIITPLPMYDIFTNCLAGGFEHVNKDDMSYIVEKYPKLLEILKFRYPLTADAVKPL
jgi:hypothetical protein